MLQTDHLLAPVLLISLVIFQLITPTAETYTLSLHDALPISPFPAWAAALRPQPVSRGCRRAPRPNSNEAARFPWSRSEEHTSELQSRFDLVCRLLLEKKKERAGQL